MLFLGGGCMELLCSNRYKQVALYAFIAYIIGFATAFLLHWIYQFIVAKITAPKVYGFLAANMNCSRVVAFLTRKDARSMVCYQLEIVNQGFQQLCEKLITEDEFITLVKKSG